MRPQTRPTHPPGAHRPRTCGAGLAIALVLAPGCYTGLGLGPGSAGGADDGDGGSADDGGSPDDDVHDPRMYFTCTDEQRAQRGLTFDRLRRLSSQELVHTLTDLLGEEMISDGDIAQRLSGMPTDQTVLPGDFVEDPPLSLALTMSAVAARASELAIGDPSWIATHLPTCAAAGTIDEACAETLARELGGRIWRRDLRDDEVATYVGYFTASGGGSEGLGYMLRRLLQSPALVFHIEEGTPGDDGSGRIRLTDFEVASRISYFTTDSMPDDELFAAARAGELGDLDAVEDHVRRLLTSERAIAKVRDFFRYYSRLTSVADPLPAIGELVGVPDTNGLGQQMQDEAYAFYEHIVWNRDGTFADLMGSTDAFPRTDALATVFATAVATGDEPVTAAAHPGLLHRPALLASGGPRTSPIIRGAHVRKLFLCESLPLPDPEAVQERKDEVGDLEGMSNRDKVTRLTEADACTTCHSQINGVGFTFEGYDQLGVPRAQETVLDADGNVVATWPLDTRADMQLEPDGPDAFADSHALAQAMVESYRARTCFSRRVFEYYRLAAADDGKDGCALHGEEVRSHHGSLVDVFVAAIANEDIFWRKAP